MNKKYFPRIELISIEVTVRKSLVLAPNNNFFLLNTMLLLRKTHVDHQAIDIHSSCLFFLKLIFTSLFELPLIFASYDGSPITYVPSYRLCLSLKFSPIVQILIPFFYFPTKEWANNLCQCEFRQHTECFP